MSENKSLYRQIFKTTSIFGGVQVFNILINIIRSKFVAVLLGPAGMGIVGLLNSTLELLGRLTSFGISTSAIKNIAAATTANDSQRIEKVVTVFRRLVWITGFLGLGITAILSPWLSELSFGNRNYTIAFILLSVTLLINQISAGQGVVLRAMRKVKYMVQSGMIGSVLSLLFIIPLYYYYKEDGIVAGIIITSVTGLLLSFYFSKKIKIGKHAVDKAILKTEGFDMLRMGFMVSLSGLITLSASYIIRIFISKNGGTGDVGLFTAGFAIVNTYIGMVFTAMSADYYPRLAGVAHDNQQVKSNVNYQAEIAVLILAPMITTLLVYIDWVVMLLYSKNFIAAVPMIHWAALGIFFKAASWAIGFILLAKGANKIFFWNELVANSYVLLFNIIGYKYGGVEGLGISFLIGYFIYLLQLYFLCKNLYKFDFSLSFFKIFSIQITLAFICFFIIRIFAHPINYIAGTTLIIVSFYISYREMDKRIGVTEILKSIKSKIIKR